MFLLDGFWWDQLSYNLYSLRQLFLTPKIFKTLPCFLLMCIVKMARLQRKVYSIFSQQQIARKKLVKTLFGHKCTQRHFLFTKCPTFKIKTLTHASEHFVTWLYDFRCNSSILCFDRVLGNRQVLNLMKKTSNIFRTKLPIFGSIRNLMNLWFFRWLLWRL